MKKLPSLNASATVKATKEAFSILGTPPPSSPVRSCLTMDPSSCRENTMSSVKIGTFATPLAVRDILNLMASLSARSSTSSLSSKSAWNHLVIFI